MLEFVNKTVIDYPIEEVFAIFIKTAKRDFPKFNSKNPIGTTTKREIGNYSKKKAEATITITDFKENEVYAIKTVTDTGEYSSTYIFKKIDDSSCQLTLREEQTVSGIFGMLNNIMHKFLYKKSIRTRFQYFVQGLNEELKRRKENIERSTKKAD